MSSMFNKRPGQGGGGAPPTPVADNLVTDSGNIALSARQGIVLDTMIKDHEKVIASETALGHVKVDGSTIKIDPTTGIISSIASGGDSVTHAQAILPTTVADQQTWNIPFSNYKYPDDLLIVTHNSTVVDTNGYTITQNIDGVSWDVNIPMQPQYSRPVDENVVFVIMIKGMGTGGGGSSVTVEDVLTSTSPINALSANMGRVLKNQLDTHELIEASNTVLGHVMVDGVTITANNGVITAIGSASVDKPAIKQFIAETLIDPLGGFHYKIASYIPEPTDRTQVNFNTTTLTSDMFNLTNDGTDTYIKLLVQESTIQSKNNVAGIIYRNFDAF